MKHLTALLLILGCSLSLKAQQEDPVIPLRVSYFAPYVVQPGLSIGTSFDLIDRREDPQEQYRTESYFSIRPEIGYFVNPGVHRNLLMETGVMFTMKKSRARSYMSTGFALAYLLTTENVEGSVHLGNGSITHETSTDHALLPMFNLEFGLVPVRHLGYFINVFYGERLSVERPNAALFGAEIGLTIYFNPKSAKDE